MFHPLNAHDDGERSCSTWSATTACSTPSGLGAGRLGAPPPVALDPRPHHRPAHEEQLGDQPFEFPRVDERLVGRPHRWGYGAPCATTTTGDNAFGGDLVRIDGKTGDLSVIRLGAGRAAGEWSMVPRHRRRRRGRRLAA